MKTVTAWLLVVLFLVIGVGLFWWQQRAAAPPVATVTESPAATPTPTVTPSPTPTPTPTIQPIPGKVKATIQTSLGDIELELDGTSAPLTVGNFVKLARENFYDVTTFHRVIPDFMIQGGDPLSKDQAQRPRHGTGGPGYTFRDEINTAKVVRGVIAMANAGPSTNGSQFFIVVGQAFPNLDGKHTVFGKVTKGMEIVDAISKVATDANNNPLTPVTIKDVVLAETVLTLPTPSPTTGFAPVGSSTPTPTPTGSATPTPRGY